MEDMARIWPIIVQFGVGAVLCGVGLWAGLSSGFVNLSVPEDRRSVGAVAFGFAALLVLALVFTFWLPNLGNGSAE